MADDIPSSGSAGDDTSLNGATSHNGVSPETTSRPNPYEGAVPPGYDWPTHGGYLGCLLGVIAACLIGGFLGSTFFSALSLMVLPVWAAALLTLVVFLGCVAGLGRLGWVLGRRFYREYPQPCSPVWGQDDVPDEAPDDEQSDTSDDPAAEQPDPGERRWLMP